jgi:hypothetical protein
MQFRPMMTAAEKSPAFLRASLVLAATSSFLPAVFSLSVCLSAWLLRTNRIYQFILYIFIVRNVFLFMQNC